MTVFQAVGQTVPACGAHQDAMKQEPNLYPVANQPGHQVGCHDLSAVLNTSFVVTQPENEDGCHGICMPYKTRHVINQPELGNPVTRHQAYLYRLKPSPTQVRALESWAASCREVWNALLNINEARQNFLCWSPDFKARKLTNRAAMGHLLTQWRGQFEDVRAVPQKTQEAAKDALADAYLAAMKGIRKWPRYKTRHSPIRLTCRGAVSVDLAAQTVRLPKLGAVRCIFHRPIEGTIKRATVSHRAGHWYVSIQTERQVPAPVHPSPSAVGVDVGVVKMATLSDGTVYPPGHHLARHEKRLKRAQRDLSRKVKGSSNWKRQKAKLARIHARIADTRNDYLHKASHSITRDHSLVVIEDLKVANMTASAAGTVEAPGRNVAAKAGLNKAILDVGWYEFRRQLTYKAEWRGGRVVAVNPRHTSQRCHQCGHVSPDNRRTQAAFRCVACGHQANADLNAARNILEAAQAIVTNLVQG